MTLVSPKSSKCNISISNCPIAFKFDTEVKYLKLHTKIVNVEINTQTAFFDDTFVTPKSSKCNISMNNGPIALKVCTGVQSQQIEEYIYGVNTTHMVISGQLRANMPK